MLGASISADMPGVVAEGLEKLESFHCTEPKGTTPFCSTGDPYVTIAWTLNGTYIKPEGQRATFFESKDLAWMVWLAGFKMYLQDRYGRIHWRMYPEIFEETHEYSLDMSPPKPLPKPVYAVAARVFVPTAPAHNNAFARRLDRSNDDQRDG